MKQNWWIDDDPAKTPNEVYVRSRWGCIEVSGFSSSKRSAIAQAIMERLKEFQTDGDA
jgi:hypothetical protein